MLGIIIICKNDNRLVYTIGLNKQTYIVYIVNSSKIFLNNQEISEDKFKKLNLDGKHAQIKLNGKILEKIYL